MRQYITVCIVFGLTLLHILSSLSGFSLWGSTDDTFPEGSYTSTLTIMSNEQEYHGENKIMVSVVNGGLSLHVQREYNQNDIQCVGSNLYAKGLLHSQEQGIMVEFTKVVDQVSDRQCPSQSAARHNLAQIVDHYTEKPFLLTSTYQDKSVYCFESSRFGGLCLNKE